MKWKNIRFFVSSTFKDMDVERDALHSIVEPKLNEYLSRYYCSVEFVDLRHSVKTDANKEHADREKEICAVCLKEIDRCSPYFIGFLGHRYGWIPPRGLMDRDDSVSYPSSMGFDRLSVTAHEFVYGLSKNGIKGLVFLRNESSYRQLPQEVMGDYWDEGDSRALLERFRNYVTDNDSLFHVVPYELNLADINIDTIGPWVDRVCDAIIDLIQDELSDDANDSDLNDFLRCQELYVQNQLRSFRGRTVELEECRKKIESRSGCILSMREYGLGVKSFHCKLYSEYRKDSQNICLFYSPHANVGYGSIEQAMYFWTLYLNRECFDGKEVVPEDWKRQFPEVCDILKRMTERLENEGRTVYAFVGTSSSVHEYLSRNSRIVNIIFCDENSRMLRPLMYVLEPFRKETVREIVSPLRTAVGRRLMEHERSRYAEWLSVAVEQLQNLNRLDFILIRNDGSGDQEQSIIDHQLRLIDSFPQETVAMKAMWIEKMRKALGGNLVDSLIYFMGLNPSGIHEKDLCRILEIDLVSFTMIRQLLGSNVLYEAGVGKWALVDGKIWNELKDSLDYEAIRGFNHRMKEYLRQNPASELYDGMIFKMDILTNDIESCVRFLDCDDALGFRELQAFRWYAENQLESFKGFIERLMVSLHGSYRLIYNIILCMKRLCSHSTKEIYLYTITSLKNRMRNLWDNKGIDSRSFSLLGDVLACEADYYRMFGNYSVFKDCMRYNLMFSAERMKDECLWTKHYLYYIISLFDVLQPDARYDFLVKNFLTYENGGLIRFSEDDDPTTYAIVLCYAADQLIGKGKGEKGAMLLKKGFATFNRFLLMQRKHSVETVLQPHDTMRNILLYLDHAYYIYENTTDAISLDWLSAITDVMMEHCHECKERHGDQSFWHYYSVAVKAIRHSASDRKEKIDRLYDLLYEATSGKPFQHIVIERQIADVNGETIVFFTIYAAILHELSLMDGHQYELPESFYDRMYGVFESVLKKEKYQTFDSLLGTILPVMGAKMDNDSHMVPAKLKAAMIDIYEAMLNVELEKDVPDADKVTSVANSLYDEINALYIHYSVKYQLKFRHLDKLLSILEENCGNHSRFDDFTDVFGMEGNVFVESWKDDEDEELSYYLELKTDEEECKLNQEELEEYIESDLCHEIIDVLSEETCLTFYEAYYLALAYLRTCQFETAFLLYNRLAYFCYDEKIGSAGEFFSVLTNLMISALMADRIEEFENALRLLSADDYEDEDIQMILSVYDKMKEDPESLPDFPQPYGFVI